MAVSSSVPKDFAHASLLAAPLDFRPLDTAVIRVRAADLVDASLLPLKPVRSSSTKLKSIVERLSPMPSTAFDFDSLYSNISRGQYGSLPNTLAADLGPNIKFKMQLVGQQADDGQWTFFKHYVFESKMCVKLLRNSLPGELFIIDYGKNFRAGLKGFQYLLEHVGQWSVMWFQVSAKEAKSKSKEKSDLEAGFKFIRTEGPRSNMHNRQTEWTEVEIHREGSPIFGWSAGLVKESLRGYATSNVFADRISNFHLTLYDLSAGFLHDVIIPLLPTLKSKTVVFMGLAEKGKTPAAQALALAMSEYWLLVDNMAWEQRPAFRLCASLDQLRGEPGVKHVPDILDDPDCSQIPISKLKAFLDSTLEETFTVERWTTSKFVRHQLRILCDNKVNESAEEDIVPGQTTIPFDTFLNIIDPAFPDKSSKQDKMALLKRAHWVVNLRRAIYVRKAGAGTAPVPLVHYVDGITDFLADSGKSIMANMQDGVKDPPADWMEKRQWSHDLVTMVLEKGMVPERTTVCKTTLPFSGVHKRVETKPDLPFSGRVVVDIAPEDVEPQLLAPAQEPSQASGVSHSYVMPALSAGVVAPVPEVPEAPPAPEATLPAVPGIAPCTPVPVKIEPGTFSSLRSGSNEVVIDLDSATPSPEKPKRRRLHGKQPADEDGADFPQVGQADDED